jgi:DMSO/TMAO reductase YedYZ heme-binding membrane subunit
MIVHILMFTVQRLTRAGGWNGPTLYQLFVQEPWLLAATVGTGMLIMVVVTSIRAARRRLRYESWHLLHLYAYLGMGLALPHQIVDGEDFHQTVNRVYWWTIYAVAALLAFRVALPIWRSLYHDVRVASSNCSTDCRASHAATPARCPPSQRSTSPNSSRTASRVSHAASPPCTSTTGPCQMPRSRSPAGHKACNSPSTTCSPTSPCTAAPVETSRSH